MTVRNSKSYKMYILSDDGLERLKSAIKRLANQYKGYKIYRVNSPSYNYSQLKALFKEERKFQINDETLKFVLEKIIGVRQTTIRSLFDILSEPFNTTYIKIFESSTLAKYNNEIICTNHPVFNHREFIGRTEEVSKILKFIGINKIHPYIVVINGESGIGKTAIVRKIVESVRDANIPQLAYEVIFYVQFEKKYQHPNRKASSELNKDYAINYIFRSISETLNDTSIVNVGQELQNKKIYETLENNKSLLIVDDFHNIEEIEEQVKVSNFFANLPISTKVILTTQKSILIGYEIKLSKMSEDDLLEIVETEGGSNNNIDPDWYDGNPSASILVTNWVKESREVIDGSCSADDNNTLYCYLGKVLKADLDSRHFNILISIALFNYISTESLLEISGVDASPEIDYLIEKWKSFTIIHEDEKKRYYMESSKREYILSLIQEKYEDQVKTIFDNALIYYSKLTEINGGVDWGNWKIEYNIIKEEWPHIKLILDYCLIKEQEEAYKHIKKIWDNVNHFADMCGYYIERLAWLEWLRVKSENKDWMTYSKSLSRSAWTRCMMGGKENFELAILSLDDAMKVSKEHLDENIFQTKFHKLNILHHYLGVFLETNQNSKACIKLKEQEEIFSTFDGQNIEDDNYKLFIRCKMNYLRSLAKYYQKIGEHENAKNNYQEVLKLASENNWPRGVSIAANNLADIEIDSDSGDLEKASGYLLQAMIIAKFNEYERRQARCNLSYAKLENKSGNRQKSVQYAKLALDYYLRFNKQDKIEEATILLEVF